MSGTQILPQSESATVPAAAPSRWWLVVAVVAGALLGPLDLWGQVASPYPWAHLFNSPAVWAAAAFAYGRWARHRVAAPVGATIVLVVAVEAYYLADVLVREADRANLTSPTAFVWLVAGIVAGLVFGTAGAWAATPCGWRAVLGRAALPAVLGAEATYNVMRIANEPADGRPDDLGQFAALLAALGLGVLIALIRHTDRRTATRVAGLAIGAAVSVGIAAATVI
jgi:hypothetical protein